MNDGADPSDLEALVELVAPDLRADFLRWRARLHRYEDNDEILALTGYLGLNVVLTDRIARGMVQEVERIVTAFREELSANASKPPAVSVAPQAAGPTSRAILAAVNRLATAEQLTALDQRVEGLLASAQPSADLNPPTEALVRQLEALIRQQGNHTGIVERAAHKVAQRAFRVNATLLACTAALCFALGAGAVALWDYKQAQGRAAAQEALARPQDP